MKELNHYAEGLLKNHQVTKIVFSNGAYIQLVGAAKEDTQSHVDDASAYIGIARGHFDYLAQLNAEAEAVMAKKEKEQEAEKRKAQKEKERSEKSQLVDRAITETENTMLEYILDSLLELSEMAKAPGAMLTEDQVLRIRFLVSDKLCSLIEKRRFSRGNL